MNINETLIDLNEARALPVFRRRGRAPALEALYRWINAGILTPDGTRARLETIRQPAGLMTSMEAIERFIARINGQTVPAVTPTPRGRAKQIDAAARELEQAGFEVGTAQ